MPLSHGMVEVMKLWLVSGIPEQVVAAVVMELLIGEDVEKQVPEVRKAQAGALANALVREGGDEALKHALKNHEIVSRWAAWQRVVQRIREKFGSVTRAELAEIYRRFCAGELRSMEEIDAALELMVNKSSFDNAGSTAAPGIGSSS